MEANSWLIVIAVVALLFIFVLCLPVEGFAKYVDKMELRKKVPNSARALKATKQVLDKSHNQNIDHIIAKSISMDRDNDPSEHFFEIAERFHKTFMDNEIERRTQIRKLYKELKEPESVVIVFFCKDYFKFFKNWVLSCERVGIKVRDKTIAFALDEEAGKLSRDYGFKTFVIDSKYEKAGGAKAFGDKAFAATMFYKNALIYDMLQIIPNDKFLLFQDSDLIWFNNPIAFLQNQSKTHGYEIQMMYDGPNYHYKNMYGNSGFIFLKSCDATRAVFETALRNSAYIFSGGSHQKPLEKIFEHFILHNVLNFKILNETMFLNGHLFKTNGSIDKKVPKNWKTDSFVFHFSWSMDAVQKIQKLDAYGLNFIGI